MFLVVIRNDADRSNKGIAMSRATAFTRASVSRKLIYPAVLWLCCMKMLAGETSRFVPIATFRSADEATKQEVRAALHSAHINYGMANSYGTTVGVATGDAPEAKRLLHALAESGKASVRLVKDFKTGSHAR
jgi:hypothetical protein